MTGPKLKQFYRLTTLLFFITALFISACKKGDDDPLISFRSRKTRLTGEWQLVKTTVNNEPVTPTSQNKIEFDKDGYGKETVVFQGATISRDLRWSFVSAGGEYKNKERLVIYNQSSPGGSVYDIIELRNKRLVIEYQNNNDFNRLYYEQD